MEPITITLALVPAPEESESVETIAAAVELLDETRLALVAAGYQAQPISDGQRGDLLQIAFDLAQQVTGHQVELGALLTVAITTLTTLSKHRRVGKLELSRGDEKVIIEDTDRAVVERVTRAFAERTAASRAPTRITASVARNPRRR